MFDPQEFEFEKVKNLPDVVHYAEIIEEVALLKYGTQIYPATVKGVPENYTQYTAIDSLIIDGKFMLEDQGINYTVVGQGVAYNLGIRPEFTDHIMVYVPKKGKQVSINPARAINHNYIFASGVFAVLEEIDSKYIIVSKKFAADLFESNNQVSTVELGINPAANQKKVQKEVEKILGDKFHVKNKYQQHDLIYKTMQSEKWAAYLILVFILIIASFNILSSLSMLIIDKKEDIHIFRSMGASSKTIGQIFSFRRLVDFNCWGNNRHFTGIVCLLASNSVRNYSSSQQRIIPDFSIPCKNCLYRYCPDFISCIAHRIFCFVVSYKIYFSKIFYAAKLIIRFF
jgi:lipoprotein-releasing system permease protein